MNAALKINYQYDKGSFSSVSHSHARANAGWDFFDSVSNNPVKQSILLERFLFKSSRRLNKQWELLYADYIKFVEDMPPETKSVLLDSIFPDIQKFAVGVPAFCPVPFVEIDDSEVQVTFSWSDESYDKHFSVDFFGGGNCTVVAFDPGGKIFGDSLSVENDFEISKIFELDRVKSIYLSNYVEA